jgi:ATP phosphoribosyltransferase regulatory subunit
MNLDFSIVNDISYYSGIIFQGYIEGIPEKVLSGGRYDKLLRKFGNRSGAVGFAVYLDLLERCAPVNRMINVALPKGRLGEKAYAVFEAAGYGCPDIYEESRRLVFENHENKVRYFWVKPSDVAIYVERGAADIGVAGKDILLEYSPDVYELLDLGIGKCRMCVAAGKGFSQDNHDKTLRVATKFPNIARDFYEKQGREIDVIGLNGSIEIAPLLGLSDVIVDIVESGKTLLENNLEPIETIVDISARLISNKASYRFNHEAISELCMRIAAEYKDSAI